MIALVLCPHFHSNELRFDRFHFGINPLFFQTEKATFSIAFYYSEGVE